MKKSISFLAMVFFILVSCSPSNEKEMRQCTEERQRLEANKKMVAGFYQSLFGDKNISVVDSFIVENYIQHNPMAADGRQALKDVLSGWFSGAPKDTIDIQHIAADGNLVFLHTRSQFGDKTVSVIDIFRIENGKIAEHWDVIQEVPDSAANDHPMF